MDNRIVAVIIDAIDPELLAAFWTDVLGWDVVHRAYFGVSIGADTAPFSIHFRQVPDGPKAVKNRLHLDIAPVHRSQADEHERLLALGAVPTDVGQGTPHWYVLADPEGNEFCLCRPA